MPVPSLVWRPPGPVPRGCPHPFPASGSLLTRAPLKMSGDMLQTPDLCFFYAPLLWHSALKTPVTGTPQVLRSVFSHRGAARSSPSLSSQGGLGSQNSPVALHSGTPLGAAVACGLGSTTFRVFGPGFRGRGRPRPQGRLLFLTVPRRPAELPARLRAPRARLTAHPVGTCCSPPAVQSQAGRRPHPGGGRPPCSCPMSVMECDR